MINITQTLGFEDCVWKDEKRQVRGKMRKAFPWLFLWKMEKFLSNVLKKVRNKGLHTFINRPSNQCQDNGIKASFTLQALKYYYYQSGMRNYNEQKYCDLPLQTRPFFDNQPNQKRMEDRPKQIDKDLYRMQSAGKENRIKSAQGSSVKQGKKEEGEVCCKALCEKVESKVVEESKYKKNENLRNIIKKQLFSNEKVRANKLNYLQAETFEEKRKVESKGINMYQRLLCEVYGQPKLSKNKSLKKLPKQFQQRPENPMKRHDSSNTLTKPKQTPLLRYQSQSILQPFPQPQIAPSSSKYSQKPKIREQSYLQLYLQKRKPLLFL